MHRADLPQFAQDSALKRRGRLHLYEEIDAARTALVVIDMQNMFLQEGAPAEVPIAREIVPQINRLAGATRDAGGTVVWVQITQTEANRADWSVFYNGANHPERPEKALAWLTEGADGHKLWPGLEVRDDDWVVLKFRYSAFLPGASDIEERLRAVGIDTVLITGTLTNVCCESSARDAQMRNFKVVMVSDANATHTDAEHTATLVNMAQVFGDVRTTDDVISCLQTGAHNSRQPRAAE